MKKNKPQFKKSKFANLYLNKDSGLYHCHAKVHGRLVRKCLDTASVEIAKIKLDQLLSAERGKDVTLEVNESCKFADLVGFYEENLARRVLKPRALDYRLGTIKAIRKMWPGIDRCPLKQFDRETVYKWAFQCRTSYSPTYYNGMMQTMRGILQVACDAGVIASNPAESRKRNSTRGVPAAPVPLTPPELPSAEKFNALLAALDSKPDRKAAATFVRFLAYSGARIGAAQQLMPRHIDLEKNIILIPCIKKETQPTRLPMNAELRALAEQMLKEHPGGDYPLMPIMDPKKSLMAACKEAGIEPRITPHGLRHLFATRCLESGVDVKTCATWLGHVDGGALLLQRYAHLRDQHSQEMAAKIKLASVPTKAPEHVPEFCI